MAWTSFPVAGMTGVIAAPGDKSCSHRALILASLAEGTSDIDGLLEGEDVLRTADAMRAVGAEIDHFGDGRWKVTGVGTRGFSQPSGPLDFGNSGTGARLIMGAIAAFAINCDLQGDASLSKRPMNRVLLPLREMGASDTAGADGQLPFTLIGSNALKAIDFTPPQASAQVKSAILLAGLNAEGQTGVHEARATRDHTERMLRGFGAHVDTRTEPGGVRTIQIEGGQRLEARETSIPGDPSSAAFLIAAGLISPNGDVLVERVMSNSTRDGLFDALAGMGVELGAEEAGEAAGERLIDLQAATPTRLKGCHVPERLVPAMIDEFPILAVIAAFAEGETRVTGAKELRVKESDRIEAVADMLRVNGVEVETTPDGFIVQGCGGPPPGGGQVETRHDHRIAMSALVMGTAAQQPVSVDDISMIATSYPDFLAHMATLGADIRQDDGAA